MRGKKVSYINNRYSGEYLTQEVCDKLELIRKIDEEKSFVSDLKHGIYDLSESDIDLIIQAQSSNIVGLEKKLGTLANNQTTGVLYMYLAKRMILADSVGVGKTPQVAGLVNILRKEHQEKHLFPFKYLYLTEVNPLESTRRKMIRFTGEYVDSLQGVKSKVEKFAKNNLKGIQSSGVVGTHSLLTSIPFQEFIRGFEEENGYFPFDLIVIDESGSILKNSKNKAYQSGLHLTKDLDRVILLNATPFEKDLLQYYNQLAFVDPTLLPTLTSYREQYEIPSYKYGYPQYGQGKYKNEEDFRYKVGYRCLQRTRASIGATMEDCTAEVILTEVTKEQRELLNKVSMPQMVLDCPSYFKLFGMETTVETTPKLRELVKLCCSPELIDEKILIYARYKEAQESIENALSCRNFDVAILNGDTPSKVRNELIDGFTRGTIQVLVTDVQKGLDFGECNYCIFYNYNPNPNEMVQLEGRITRSLDIIGKHTYMVISRGREFKSLKKAIATRANASTNFVGRDYSNILDLLSLEYLESLEEGGTSKSNQPDKLVNVSIADLQYNTNLVGKRISIYILGNLYLVFDIDIDFYSSVREVLSSRYVIDSHNYSKLLGSLSDGYITFGDDRGTLFGNPTESIVEVDDIFSLDSYLSKVDSHISEIEYIMSSEDRFYTLLRESLSSVFSTLGGKLLDFDISTLSCKVVTNDSNSDLVYQNVATYNSDSNIKLQVTDINGNEYSLQYF